MSEIGRTVDVHGIATNYHDEGDGPVVLLIHGSGPGVSAWANWRLTIPMLSKRFRVIAPDIVGFGYTEGPAGIRYDAKTWVGHLKGLLDALNLESVSVVGNSFGGGLALRLALMHPRQVDRLVLMGSVGVTFPITDALDAVWGFEPSLASMREMLDIFAYDKRFLSDDLAQLRYEAATRPGVLEAYQAMFPPPRQRALDTLSLTEEQVSAVSQETLIIHGRDDRVIPLEASQRLLQLIQRSQMHVFGQCGHWVQIEHANRFAKLVEDFLSESSA
jgi:2-hydroxymuconate-semialdehyde hydrolase